MTHPGIVTAVKPGFVTVQITSVSACASCQAHSRCGFAESKTKTLDIPSSNLQPPTSDLQPGDKVTVTIDHTRGLLATWWAYILPALLLLAVAVPLSLLGLPEPLVIFLTLAALVLYILFLYLFKKKLDSKFTLTLTPTSDPC